MFEWSNSLLDRFSQSNKKIPVLTKIPYPRFPHWPRRCLPYSFNAIWKTLTCFTFPTRVVELICTYFLVWLWTVIQFNTPKNEILLKVLLVIGNGFFICTWKYGIWISKNEKILRITASKVCWFLSNIVCGRVTLFQLGYWI